MRTKRAFSLIELLVVIAVIAILAAILFPVFSRAKASAKQTTCMSNLKQVGTAILLYMSDYDDLFPNAVDAADKFHPEIWSAHPEFMKLIPDMPMMHELLQGYIRNYEVFQCPSDVGSQVLDRHPDISFPASPTMFAAYGLSYMYRTEITFRRLRQTQLEDVAGVNVLFDGGGHWHPNMPPLTIDDENALVESKRHDFRYNLLYGDMHVKSVRFDALQQAWATPL